MSEHKHTPGPWAVRNMTDVYPVDDTSGRFFVADCWPEIEPAFGTDLTLEAAHANAKLIAAAPELLEAAQEAFRYLDTHVPWDDPEVVPVLDKLAAAVSLALDGRVMTEIDEVVLAIGRALAAISKAEEEE